MATAVAAAVAAAAQSQGHHRSRPMATKIRFRELLWPVFLPALAATLAQTLPVPVLPIWMDDALSQEAASIGFVVSLQGLGSFVAGAPAGLLTGKLGERYAMLTGAGIRLLAYVACFAAALMSVDEWTVPAVVLLLSVARFITGLGMGTFQVARQTFLAAAVPKALRGRTNSLVGGCARVANFVGPAVGGWLYQAGGATWTFAIQSVIGVLVLALLIFGVPQRPKSSSSPNPAIPASSSTACSNGAPAHTRPEAEPSETARAGATPSHVPNPSSMMRLLASAPVGFSFAFARAARQLLIPVCADRLCLSASAVGGVVAVSFACDSLCFPLAGLIMDRCGRKWAGVPSLAIMSAGFALLALSVATGESSVHGSRTASYSVNSASSTSEGSGSNGSSTDEEIGSVTILVLASSILGVGNALSAGILMTVAADAAPPDATSRARFIGLFKVVSDSGTFAGPMIVGVVSQYVGLPSACVLLCAFTLSIAVWYAALGPEGLAAPATNSSQPAGAELHSCADDSPTCDACAPSSIRIVTASSAGAKRWRLRRESQARLVDHDSAALNRSEDVM